MVTYKFLNVIEKCINCGACFAICKDQNKVPHGTARVKIVTINEGKIGEKNIPVSCICLLYTSPSPRDGLLSRMPSSA